jgi:hypothetical protein
VNCRTNIIDSTGSPPSTPASSDWNEAPSSWCAAGSCANAWKIRQPASGGTRGASKPSWARRSRNTGSAVSVVSVVISGMGVGERVGRAGS